MPLTIVLEMPWNRLAKKKKRWLATPNPCAPNPTIRLDNLISE